MAGQGRVQGHTCQETLLLYLAQGHGVMQVIRNKVGHRASRKHGQCCPQGRAKACHVVTPRTCRVQGAQSLCCPQPVCKNTPSTVPVQSAISQVHVL